MTSDPSFLRSAVAGEYTTSPETRIGCQVLARSIQFPMRCNLQFFIVVVVCRTVNGSISDTSYDVIISCLGFNFSLRFKIPHSSIFAVSFYCVARQTAHHGEQRQTQNPFFFSLFGVEIVQRSPLLHSTLSEQAVREQHVKSYHWNFLFCRKVIDPHVPFSVIADDDNEERRSSRSHRFDKYPKARFGGPEPCFWD